jgi:hypothetical protein
MRLQQRRLTTDQEQVRIAKTREVPADDPNASTKRRPPIPLGLERGRQPPPRLPDRAPPTARRGRSSASGWRPSTVPQHRAVAGSRATGTECACLPRRHERTGAQTSPR